MRKFLFSGLAAVAAGTACLLEPVPAAAADSVVVIMYHRFGEDAHPSTNIRLDQFEAHLAELANSQYTVLPIPEVVDRLKKGESLPNRTVALSIDDAFLSVYREAWPRLKAAGFPFTLFVATEPVNRGQSGYMDWDQIRELKKAGVTIGSQTHSHLHMASSSAERNRGEIEESNSLFRAELGEAPTIIAYPYGEYSLAVREVAKEAGFTAGFGQHSGVLFTGADMYYLPRFSMTENFGDISRFKLAANALPLRVKEVSPADPLLSPANNPPLLGFTVAGDEASRLARLSCYPSNQSETRLERLGSRVEVRLDTAFPAGRARINCTMPAPSGRWHWYGLQFFVPRP
ncbi:MAG: polysaccharide deacetylase family protein [Alphaproteobacteria bacterium]